MSKFTESDLESYERDGFIIVRRFFDAKELASLLEAYRADPSIRGSLYGMLDDDGAPHPICIWTDLADDVIGMIPRMARMVDGTESLLGEPCYHWHSKLTVKPPGCKARIDWHQDYTSWYDDGLLFPNLLTVGVAIEPATRANGCLQLVPGSHRIGRLSFERSGGLQLRIERATDLLGIVHCELNTGDAVFFHANTLHGSASNESDKSRLMLFSSYNAKSNEPIPNAQGVNEDGAFMGISADERKYKPIDKLPDDVLSKQKYLSAFGQTQFKVMDTGLADGYTQVTQLT